jgi:hypothetical protein
MKLKRLPLNVITDFGISWIRESVLGCLRKSRFLKPVSFNRKESLAIVINQL